MSQSNMIHSSRRMQHALTGVLFYALSFLLRIHDAKLLLFVASSSFYILHKMRKSRKHVQELYLTFFGSLLREKEKEVHHLPGAFWFLLGVTIVFAFFDVWIARISLLCLSIGDPIAAIVGIQYGHGSSSIRRRHQKSLYGSLACFGVCFLICILNIHDGENIPCKNIFFRVMASTVTAAIVTICEYLGSSDSYLLNDNILMPIGGASSLRMLVTVCTNTSAIKHNR